MSITVPVDATARGGPDPTAGGSPAWSSAARGSVGAGPSTGSVAGPIAGPVAVPVAGPESSQAASPAGNPAAPGPALPTPGLPAQFLWCWVLLLLVAPTALAVALLLAGAGSAIVWIGLPIWLLAVGYLRLLTRAYRAVAGRLLGERFGADYLPLPRGNLFQKLRTALVDPTRWRDVAYAFFAVTLGASLSISALVTFIVFPIGYWLSPLLLRLWASATRAIIGPTGEAALHRRIGTLEDARSETLDHSAAELRRIERDLHDGAQAHLIAVGLNLGMAEELMPHDPQAARALIADARESSRTALAELRSLVRGIHPPVLADRGLTGAVQALALAQPHAVEVDVQLPARPPQPLESAMYFAIAEALTNSAKHSSARSGWVWVRHEQGTLSAMVGDDGVGGAQMIPGGGLDGIHRRMAAFDGTVTLSSPVGGPTIVTITAPCAGGEADR